MKQAALISSIDRTLPHIRVGEPWAYWGEDIHLNRNLFASPCEYLQASIMATMPATPAEPCRS